VIAERRVPSARPIAAATGLAFAACAVWALWPLPAPHVEIPSFEAPPIEQPQRKSLPPLDLAAFRAPLWVAQPPPPALPAPTPPPPPLRLQLVAIVQEHGAYKAALYDPDQDKLFIVGAGESVSGRTIEQVGSGAVTIRDGGLLRTVSLKSEGNGP
jgi:hypothetical protein